MPDSPLLESIIWIQFHEEALRWYLAGRIYYQIAASLLKIDIIIYSVVSLRISPLLRLSLRLHSL
jgi:hypothetical protein